MSRLREHLSFARVYSTILITSGLVFVVLVSIFLSFSISEVITLTILAAFFIIAALYYIGEKRLKEINQLKTIIDSIRNNRYKSADEIKLSKRLIELEGDIKLMFMRTQNDIANLKKLEHVRTEFLGNVSHELRTPIFAIQGYLETLLNGAINDDEVNINFLSKANLHTIRLNNLLNDLIDISMIESGQMRMSFRYFKVKDFLENMANEMRPLADNKNLEIAVHPIRGKLELFGDKDRLRQVITNLLSNAIKYTDEGKVEIIVQEQSKTAKIIIKDSGLGLAENDRERVFERFYRVDKNRSKAAGGTGLGLAIVKHIIEAHNSRVEVESTPNVGSEFSFVLKK